MALITSIKAGKSARIILSVFITYPNIDS
jgi:hypothetical protein